MLLLKRAFSLAEILVTLAIIGVIAALTIPALQQNANNAAIATNLKKIYSELNQVTANILAQNEVNKLSRTVYLDDEDTFYNEFVKKELNVYQNVMLLLKRNVLGQHPFLLHVHFF